MSILALFWCSWVLSLMLLERKLIISSRDCSGRYILFDICNYGVFTHTFTKSFFMGVFQIIPENCRFEVLSTKVEIRLAKAEIITWASLEYGKGQSVLPKPNVSSGLSQKIPAYVYYFILNHNRKTLNKLNPKWSLSLLIWFYVHMQRCRRDQCTHLLSQQKTGTSWKLKWRNRFHKR